VAFVKDHHRTSFDLDAEGAFPPFVLEVVSPASVERDEETSCTRTMRLERPSTSCLPRMRMQLRHLPAIAASRGEYLRPRRSIQTAVYGARCSTFV